jgi:small GTP-binding protein
LQDDVLLFCLEITTVELEKDENIEYANYLLRQGKNEIKIVVVGHVGYGKSALINTLFGKVVADEDDSVRSVTTEVACYTQKLYGINVIIVDTPGFFRATVQDTKDSSDGGQGGPLQGVKDIAETGDLVLACINMTGRFASSEEELIKVIVSEMGVDVLLHNTVFTLTFANEVKLPKRGTKDSNIEEHFTKKLKGMKDEIYSAIGRFTKLTESEIIKIPVVPVGHEERHLPIMDNWVAPFWYTCFKRTNPLSQVAFFAIGLGHVTNKTPSSTDSLNQTDAEHLHREVDSDPDDRNIFKKIVDLLMSYI